MLPYNERSSFALDRFVKDVKAHYDSLPPHMTLGKVGRISQEAGLARDTVMYALNGEIQSWRTICKLAGWAGLYLDEYREE